MVYEFLRGDIFVNNAINTLGINTNQLGSNGSKITLFTAFDVQGNPITNVPDPIDINDAANIKNSQIAKELALPPVKIHCSILAEDAIKAAIHDYSNRCCKV